MLVLSRMQGEKIEIGDGVEIEVVDIRGDKVRLGVTAPRAVRVDRKEIADAKRRDARAADQKTAEAFQAALAKE